ncbi:MAG: family 20 glycosylhydrolase, partial [Armatimonadota bacterium]|nr:family 20 glycosylhydrolase [Armatimonadota bacterium]
NPDENDTFTANQLRRKVWDMTGHLPEIVEGGAGAPTTNVIAIGDPAKNTAVASLISTWPEATGKASKCEGYLLGVKDGSIVIRGFDQKGTFYGCQTLILLLESYRTARIGNLFCYDYPDLAWRGMFVRVRYAFDVEFLKELISEVVARYKLNVLELDVAYGTQWTSHPELYLGDPAIASHTTDLIPIVPHARQHFIEPIPHLNGWVHTSEFHTANTMNTLLRENRTWPDPAPEVENICPRNPASVQLVHELMDELIEIFQPRYFQTGWDEISALSHSSCPYCSGTNPISSFSEFLWNDYNYLSAKGITPIMWGDMLREDMNGNDPTPNDPGWGTWRTLASMPKGTIIQDWDYSSKTDFPSLQTWNNNGSPSLGAPFGLGSGYVGKENIFYWGKSAKKYGVLGGVAFNKYHPGYKESDLLDGAQITNLGCYTYMAEWTWSPEKPYWNPLPYSAEDAIRQRISPDTPYSLTAAMSGADVDLQWTNPPDTAFQATWICYRTDRYPTDPIDGVFVCDLAGSPNGSMAYTHTTVPMGATVYYAAFSHDSVRHFSPVATASVANGTPLSPTALSSISDGETVSVNGIVTAVYDGFFYIEDEDRITGIRVESDEIVVEGNIRTITGPLGKTGMERSITALLVTGTDIKDPVLDPVAMPNSVIGGADKGFTPGSGGFGLNNVGILISSVGSKGVVAPDNSYFFIDDGSVPGGIKVILTETKTPISIPSGTYFMVTGASSLDSDGKAIIRPRDQGDIVVLR